MQNKIVAHQILVQRFGSKLARDVLPFIEQMRDDLQARLLKEGDTIKTKARLRALLSDSKKTISDILFDLDKATQLELLDFVEEEIDFNSGFFRGVDHVTPSPDQIITAATNTPMILSNQAVTMQQAAKRLTSASTFRINSLIDAGFYQGLTTQEIARNVINSTEVSKREAQTIVRTSTNFLANETRQQIYKRNDDIVKGYIITATLDFKTSDTCKKLDGKKVLYTDTKQPQPPFHFNCRTTTRPLLDEEFDYLARGATRASASGQVPQDQTYFDWLKNQPAALQDEALGKTKGKIFRNAGLTPDEFKAAAINRMNQPISLKKMRKNNDKIDDYLD